MGTATRLLGAAVSIGVACGLLAAGAAQADESMDALYAKAKTEGNTVMYTSVPTVILDEWRSLFEAEYPGVKLEYFRSGTGKVLARIDAEKTAGQLHGDGVWVADATAYRDFAKQGLLASDKTPEWEHIPFGKHPGGHYVTGRILAGVIFANAKETQDFPAGWADLADPKYKGKVAMASAIVSGSTTVMVSGLVHDAGLGWPYFQKLKDNGVLILQDVPDAARFGPRAGLPATGAADAACDAPLRRQGLSRCLPRSTRLSPRPNWRARNDANAPRCRSRANATRIRGRPQWRKTAWCRRNSRSEASARRRLRCGTGAAAGAARARTSVRWRRAG